MAFIQAYIVAIFAIFSVCSLAFFNHFYYWNNAFSWVQNNLTLVQLLIGFAGVINLLRPFREVNKDFFSFLHKNAISRLLKKGGAVLFLLPYIFVVISIAGIAFLSTNNQSILDSFFQDDLVVIIATPKGAVEVHRELGTLNQISFTFDKPMHKLGSDKKYSASKIITEPHFDCDWIWISETTLACRMPTLKRSTKYKVILEEGAIALDGSDLDDDVELSFYTSPPRVHNSKINLKDEVKLVLDLNQEIEMNSLKVDLYCGDDKFDLGEASKVEDVKRSFEFLIKEPKKLLLKDNCQYKVAAGIKPLEGSLVGTEIYTQDFSIPWDYKVLNLPFQVVEVKCSGGRHRKEIYSENITCGAGSLIELVFNREVKGEELLKYQTVFSSKAGEVIPDKSNRGKIQKNTLYQSVVFDKKMKAGQEYQVQLNSKLTSQEGEALSTTKPITIYTYGEAPEFVQRGSGIIRELNGPWRIPYESKNITSFKLRWRHLASAGEIADFFFGDSYNYSEYNEEKEIKIGFTPNITEKHPLSLKDLNSSPGLFALNMSSPKVEESYLDAYKKIMEKRYRNWGNTDKVPPFVFDKRTSVLITDIGLHAKVGYFNTLVWAFSLKTGLPLTGVSLILYNEEKASFSGVTGQDGLVTLPGRRDFLKSKNKRFVIIGQKENDITYLTEDYHFSSGISGWDFALEKAQLDSNNNLLAQAITDRPIYKPGETVSMKVFVREWDNESLSMVSIEGEELDFKVKDARGTEVFSKKIKLSEFGTTDFKFKLKEDASTGNYQVQIKKKAATGYYAWKELRSFSVQEFRKSNFEIGVKLDKVKYKKGSKAQFKLSAEYLFGGAVKKATGRIVAEFERKDFKPKQENLKSFFEHSYYDNSYSKRKKNLLVEDFETDEKGEFSKSIHTDGIYEDYGQINIEGSITDEHGASIANRTTALYYSDALHLGMKLEKWSYEKEKPIEVKAVLLNGESLLQSGRKVRIQLVKQEYLTTRRLGSGNYYYYDYSVKDEEVDSCEVKTSKDIASCKLKATEAGSYKVIGTYGEDQIITRHTYVYGGSGYISWGHFNHDRIDIIPEKENYKLGETARFLIKSPFPQARVLLTVERHGILDKKVLHIKTGAYIHEVKLDKEMYAPGIFVSAVLLQGRTSEKLKDKLDLGKPSYKVGYAQIKVENLNKKLSIKVAVTQKEYRPGTKVKGKVSLADNKGNALGGEVAIAVVDQAILQLVSSYKSKYDLYDTFYAKPSHDVENYQTLNSLMGRAIFGKKGGTPGGGGGSGSNLRSNFLPLAYWNPAVKVDKNGEVKFSFKAPDNLTKWRVIVAGVDKNHRFGYGDITFRVNKKLMLTPALPNFLTVDDRLNGKFVVHNRADKKLSLKYEINSKDFKLEDAQKVLTIDKGGKEAIFSKMTALKKGNAQFSVSVEGGGLQDGVQSFIPVIPIGTLITEALFATTQDKELEKDYVYTKRGSKDGEELNLLFSVSILQGLDEAFGYVIRYPYGCWEQRLSKTLFLGQYKQLKPWLSSFSTEIDIDTTVKKILSEAYKYQNPNGGMRFYPGEFAYASEYLSYFTAYAFMELEKAGFEVDKAVKSNLKTYLKASLNSSGWGRWWMRSSEETMKIKILYVLKEYYGENITNSLTSYATNFSSLNLTAQTFLLRSIKGISRYKKLSSKLIQSIQEQFVIEPRTVSFKIKHEEHKYMLSSTGRKFCQVASALIEAKPDLQIIPKIINKISLMRKNGRWHNTQENMFCFSALRLYAETYEKTVPNMQLTTFHNGNKISQIKLEGRSQGVQTIEIAQADIKREGKIKVLKEGEGRYYLSILKKYRTAEVNESNQNNGFRISKDIYLYDKGGNWQKLPGKTISLKRGDLVKVVLNIATDTTRYQVGVHDPLAGGLEPVNTALATASKAAAALGKPVNPAGQDKYDYFSYFYRSNGFSYMDLRLQAAQFYADILYAGSYTTEYMMQVIATGEFTMNPTRVEEMYYPEIKGLASGRKVIISE